MRYDEFAKEMSKLNVAYSKPLEKARMLVYYHHLKQYTPKQLQQAIDIWIPSSQFYPQIANLCEIIRVTPTAKEEFAELTEGEITHPTQARQYIKDMLSALRGK